MTDASLYESQHHQNQDLESCITLGRITRVYVDRRMVEVKTFLGRGPSDDNHIPQCQWVSPDANPDGDEFTSIPREGTIGLVFYINGQPFFFGGIRGIDKDGKAVTGKEAEPQLGSGDKIISTQAGNRIVVKASKIIEIISSQTLKTTYSPVDDRLRHICNNYSLRSTGGKIEWESSGAPSFTTLWSAEYSRDVARTGVVYDQIGSVSGSTMLSRRIGPAAPRVAGPAVDFWRETVDLDGTWRVDIGASGAPLNLLFNPDGSWKIKNLASELNVDAFGNISFANAAGALTVTAAGAISAAGPVASMSMDAAGALSMANPVSSMGASADGDMSIEGSGGKLRLNKGQAALGGPAGELFEELDKLLTELIKLGTALASETHLGNLGYSTSPPLNSASYLAFVTTVQAIKVIITLIKGSL